MRIALPSGARLLELPSTHSLGMASRAVLRPSLGVGVIHVYFHDTDLLSAPRRSALAADARAARQAAPPRSTSTSSPTSSADVAPDVPLDEVFERQECGVRPVTSMFRWLQALFPRSARIDREQPPPVGDIRQARASLLVRSPLRQLVIRVASLVALIGLDLIGVGLGAVRRARCSARSTTARRRSSRACSGTRRRDWLPFLLLVVVLVFWQAGLYARREQRPGFGRIVSSLVIVSLIVLAFGLGTGHKFSTFGLIPTALVISAILIGLFRASYDVVTREVLHALGVRRRPSSPARATTSSTSTARSAQARSGIDYEFVGAIAASPGEIGLPVLGQLDDLRTILAEHDVDELIVTDSDFSDRQLLDVVDLAHRSRRQGAHRAEDDRPARPARRVRARPGRAALRAAPAGAGRRRLDGQAVVRPRSSRAP